MKELNLIIEVMTVINKVKKNGYQTKGCNFGNLKYQLIVFWAYIVQ